jgi:hypothetical protein
MIIRAGCVPEATTLVNHARSASGKASVHTFDRDIAKILSQGEDCSGPLYTNQSQN